MKPITNPNDRNSEFYDLIYSDEKCEAVTSAECTLIAGLAGEAPKNILDVGIGTGRHAIPLAKMGYKITGIDFSKGMLKVLNDKDIQGINAMYGDILKMKLDKDEKFDLVILMWNSFNEIALTKSDAVKLIIKIKSILGLNGKILINIENVPSNNPYKLEFKFKKPIKGYGNVELEWKNISYNVNTNTTVSEEIIKIEGIVHKSALIKQRWWTVSAIKSILPSKMEIYSESIKTNNEKYIILKSLS